MSNVNFAKLAGLTAIAAVGLGACHPVHRSARNAILFGDSGGPMKAIARLDCPDSQGSLMRVSAAPDGRSCQYAGPGEETVTLSLVALNGQTPQAALTPIEADLKGVSPGAVPSATPANKDEDSGATVTTATGSGTAVSVKADSHGKGHDRANIDLPFLHIHTDGDKADVNLPGVQVHADGDNAHIQSGVGMKNANITANSNGAEIRAGDVNQNGANLVYILATNHPAADGYKAVGYIARGPAKGPLVVGVFKAREGRGEGRGGKDLERLINRNVRG